MAQTGSTSSSMTSTSHTMTAYPAPDKPSLSSSSSFSNAVAKSQGSGPDLLSLLAPQSRHAFIAPPPSLPALSIDVVKKTLDAFAATLCDEQADRLKEQRKKRKRGDVGPVAGEVLKIRKVHTAGFEVEQVWEQARRVIDALRSDAERGLSTLESVNGDEEAEQGEEEEVDAESADLNEDDYEDGSELGSMDGDELAQQGEFEGEQDSLDEEEDVMEDFGDDFEEDDEEHLEADDVDESETEAAGVFVEDPNHLNDGFFSIDDFNKQTEFLEQQDAAADPHTGEASDEEDIDWDQDPMNIATTKTISSTKRSAQVDDDDEEEEESDDDEEDGPTFGNVDLNAPEGDSDVDDDESVDGDGAAGDNTNDILYKEFFEPPPRKAGKGERQQDYLSRVSRRSQLQQAEEPEAEMTRAMADVRRDLFDESEREDSEDELSEVDPADPKSRRSAHERRQAKLVEEMRRLEAASVAKREWTMSGEARAADRPKDSLLDEDLEFERVGKPVPVITAEVSESIEELIKRRIIALEFDEVIRRRPDTMNNPRNSRRGAFELDDTKPQQSLAEMYEEEHVKENNPDTYVSKADEKSRKEEKEIEALWKTASAQLDALCSWHYKPKPAAPSLTVVSDVATVAMEDAQPTTASGINGGESMLAPQEIYKAGKDKNSVEKGEVVLKSGAPAARQEMTREEKLRRRRREKERIAKRGGVENGQKPLGKNQERKKEMMGDLKKGGVKVIGKKGDISDIHGNKIQATASPNGAGGFKL